MDFLLMDQLPEFCSRDNSVVMKEIFGLQSMPFINEFLLSSWFFWRKLKIMESISIFHGQNEWKLTASFILHGEDEDKLRLQTLSEVGGVDSLEKMVDCSDSEDSIENSSNAPWFALPYTESLVADKRKGRKVDEGIYIS